MTGVFETIGAALDRDPLSIDPLYEYVDSEALDLLVSSTSAAVSSFPVSVRPRRQRRRSSRSAGLVGELRPNDPP